MFLSELLVQFNDVVELVINSEFNTLGITANTYNVEKVFFYLNSLRYWDELIKNKNFSCVITTNEIYKEKREFLIDKGVILTDNPKDVFFEIHNYLVNRTNFYKKDIKNNISVLAEIHKTAVIGNNVVIGENTKICEFTVIRENSVIGNNVIVSPGCIIGNDGFQYVRNSNNLYVKHAGGVVIEDDVHLKNHVCIDKGLFHDNTIIKKNAKIDNFVQIAHGVEVGEDTLVCANAVIEGRTKVGRNCWVGPSSCLRNGIKVRENAYISMGAIVTQDVDEGKQVTGNFAVDHKKFIDNLKEFRSK